MKIIGLLNWYEESPAWLTEAVTAAGRFCDHIIAVDGPYAVFPGAMRKPYSSSEQADAIAHACAGLGIGCTIHQPREIWWGNEVGKRDFMFKLGLTFAGSSDWFFRFDADEVVTSFPPGTRQQLSESTHLVAEATLWTREIEEWYAENQERGMPVGALSDYETRLRCFYRAVPGLAIEQAHYLVTAPMGDKKLVLRGDGKIHKEEPAEPLWNVRIEHKSNRRSPARKQAKSEYGEIMGDVETIEPFEET